MSGNGYKHGSISVIIPAFNAQETIERTLASVLTQTGVSFEVVVVDDGSTDRTGELVGRIARNDTRVRVYRQENRGVAEARNRAIRESTGEWIAPIDADDIWYPENTRRQMLCAQEAGEDVGVIYSWSVDIDSQDMPLNRLSAATIRGDVFSTLLCHNFLGNGSCTLFRRVAFEEVGGYNANLAHAEDWDFYLRVAERYHFAAVERILVGYRQSNRSASRHHAMMAEAHATMLEGARQRNPGLPMWLCRLSQSNLYIYFARRHGEHAENAPMRDWLRRAAAAHRLTVLRPDWWWLLVLGRRGVRKTAPRRSAAVTVNERGRPFLRVLFSGLLHRSLARFVRFSPPEVAGKRLR